MWYIYDATTDNVEFVEISAATRAEADAEASIRWGKLSGHDCKRRAIYQPVCCETDADGIVDLDTLTDAGTDLAKEVI